MAEKGKSKKSRAEERGEERGKRKDERIFASGRFGGNERYPRCELIYKHKIKDKHKHKYKRTNTQTVEPPVRRYARARAASDVT